MRKRGTGVLVGKGITWLRFVGKQQQGRWGTASIWNEWKNWIKTKKKKKNRICHCDNIWTFKGNVRVVFQLAQVILRLWKRMWKKRAAMKMFYKEGSVDNFMFVRPWETTQWGLVSKTKHRKKSAHPHKMATLSKTKHTLLLISPTSLIKTNHTVYKINIKNCKETKEKFITNRNAWAYYKFLHIFTYSRKVFLVTVHHRLQVH